MSDKTGIEWTRGDDGTAGATWNPVTGCDVLSEGCQRCYAKTFAERWRGVPGHYFEHGFDVVLRPDKLEQPLRWKRPRRIFVNSMSDLFHKDVPDDYIAQVFAVMAVTPRHTYQVLTKRHGRMRSLLSREKFGGDVWALAMQLDGGIAWRRSKWPLPNVWLGVSAENQQWADIRIPALLDTPAAVRFVSAEPLLGPVDLRHHLAGRCVEHDFAGGFCLERYHLGVRHIDWIIAGGESGGGARRCELDWLQSLRQQSAEARIPFFAKQLGSVLGRELGAGAKGGDWDMFPDDLKVREFPRVREMECAG